MCRKRSPSQIGDGITCVGLTTDEALFAVDVAQLFEAAGVARQVTIGEFEQRFHRGEINGIVGHQHRHDTEPYLALKGLVQTVQIGNHGSLAPFIFQHEDDSENDVQQPEANEPSQQGVIDQKAIDEAQSQLGITQIAQSGITEMAGADECQTIEYQRY